MLMIDFGLLRPVFYSISAGLSVSQLGAELKLWTLVG
jgi:hypothetical protein